MRIRQSTYNWHIVLLILSAASSSPPLVLLYGLLLFSIYLWYFVTLAFLATDKRHAGVWPYTNLTILTERNGSQFYYGNLTVRHWILSLPCTNFWCCIMQANRKCFDMFDGLGNFVTTSNQVNACLVGIVAILINCQNSRFIERG